MKLKCYVVGIVLLMAAAIPAGAQILMKVSDPTQINGESVMQGFQNWTEITAFNAGSSSEPVILSGPGSNPGPAVTKCFTISMLQDKMAYYLKREMYSRGRLSNIQIDFLKNTGSGSPQTYYRVLMEEVQVTQIEEAAGEDGYIRMNVSFTPIRFRYTYWPQNPQTGALGTPVLFGWDQQTNTPW